VHPGHSVEEVRDNTGFALEVPDTVAATPAPDAGTLALLRGPIAASMHEFYPEFAARVFAAEPRPAMSH
jgi:glutaconate CoA-transferase subunit B